VEIIEKKKVRIVYIRAINDMYKGVLTSVRTQDGATMEIIEKKKG